MKNISSIIKSVFISTSLVGASLMALAEYPAPEDFVGYYAFNADLTLEDENLDYLIKDNFVFSIEQGYEGLNIIDFFSNTFIATDYDRETGALKLRTNTVRYGELPVWQYLGIADADANWSGMGAASKNPVYWQVSEDGTISIPNFTLVDYSNYTKTGTVRVVAHFDNCSVKAKTLEEEEVLPESFEGFYQFTGKMTEYIYDTSRDEVGVDTTVLTEVKVTEDAPIEFYINEYYQISRFNDEYLMEDEQLNSLRNKGYTDGKDYVMDVDMYNGTGWVYDTSNEDEIKTDAKLFNSLEAEDWDQGSEAFRMTKNEDGTFTLDPFSIWFRTIENQMGFGDEVNRVRVFRLLRKYENIKFVSYSDEAPEISDPGEPEDPTPEEPVPGEDEVEGDTTGITGIITDRTQIRYFNLQGIEISNPVKGIYLRKTGSKIEKIVK